LGVVDGGKAALVWDNIGFEHLQRGEDTAAQLTEILRVGERERSQ